MNARPIYDEEGNFIRRSEFAQDITQDVLRNQRLISLTSTVKDVQTATAISVHYMNNEGKFVWTNESYKIVGREPRDGDEDTHIIADLLSEEDRVKFDSFWRNLSNATISCSNLS